MNISRKKTRLFQEGGAMPMDAGAEMGGAPMEGGQDPIEELIMVAQQALETQDCEAAMAVCEILLQAAGGGAPDGMAPEGGMAPEEPQFARQGAKLIKRR